MSRSGFFFVIVYEESVENAWLASRVAVACRATTNDGAKFSAANVCCSDAVAMFLAPSFFFVLEILVEFAVVDFDL